MKKNVLVPIMVLLLILVGCGKGENSGASSGENSSKNQTEDSMPVSEEEAIKIARGLIDQMIAAEDLIAHGENISVDPDKTFQPEWSDTPYYLAHLDDYDDYESLVDTFKSIYSEDIFNSYIQGLFESRYKMFLEHNGDIYYAYDEPMPSDGPILVWDLSDATVNFITKDRISIYTSCEMYGEKIDGQILLVKEDGGWKLDSVPLLDPGIPNSLARMNYSHLGTDYLSVDEIIEMAGNEDNGWRLDKPISDYVVEIDPELYLIFWRSEHFPFTAVNIYDESSKGDLTLVDKIFVMGDGGDMPIYPEIDEKGIRTLDYTYLIEEPNNDTLFGYIHVPAYNEEDAIDFLYNFADSELYTQSYRVAFASDSSEFYGIIPKYYGTTVKIEELDVSSGAGKPLFTLANVNQNVLAIANFGDTRPNTRVTVSYDGDEFSFEPFLSLEDGSPINAERGDFFLYNPWDNGVG